MKRMTVWLSAFVALVLAAVGAVPVAGQEAQAGEPGTLPAAATPADGNSIQSEVAKLAAADGMIYDAFGDSVSLGGDTAFVGASGAKVGNNQWQGAVYVFYRDEGGPGAWGQAAKLTAADGEDGDEFGSSVSLDGDAAIIGAPGAYRGAAYILYRDQGGPDGWGQVAELTAAQPEGVLDFGSSVSLSGEAAAVGAYETKVGGNFYQGAAYVFYHDQGAPDAWGQVAMLTAADGAYFDWFGHAVSVSGDTLVAGAPATNGCCGKGAAYVFYRNQGGPDAWGQIAKLTAPDGAVHDAFGWSVVVSGDTAFVGAPHADVADYEGAGAVYVFYRNQGGPDTWGLVAKLTDHHPGTYYEFGSSVSLDGDMAVVGTPVLYLTSGQGVGDSLGWSGPVGEAEDRGVAGHRWQGAAYVFSRNQGGADAWGQVRTLTASDGAQGDSFGEAVSIDGGTVIVGAPDNLLKGAGYVYSLPALHLRLVGLAWAYGTQPGTYRVTATVRVHNQRHVRTGGVTVQGDWTLPDGSIRQRTGLTNREGEAKLSLWVTHAGSYQFCVTDLVKTGYAYDPGANDVPACQSIVVGP